MTTIKKCKLWLISVLAVAFVSAFGLFLGTNFKVARAADETADTTFEMVGGTSLRLEGGGGIRFRVKMGNGIKSKLKEDTTTLNFLIAPRAAFNAALSVAVGTKDEKIYYYNYDALVAKAKSTNGSRVAATMKADKSKLYDENGYTYSNLVITKVKEANRTLDMCVLAYYTEGGTNTYAKFDIERVRGNLYDVTNQAALTNKEYAEKIFANTEDYAWYGTGNYPVVVDTQAQLDVLKQVNFSGKTVLVNDESLTVPAGMNKVTNVDLNDDKEIVLGDDTSYAVGGLGEYSSATIIKATLGGKAVVYNGGNVTLNADYKANRKAHGEKILTVTVNKDGKYFNVNKNVRVVTKEIATIKDLSVFNGVNDNADYVIYGYYRLTKDVGSATDGIQNYSNLTNYANDGGLCGFRGTLDGNGKSISATIFGGGILGIVGKGAKIKDLTVNSYNYADGRTTLARSITDAIVENVTVNIKSGSSTGKTNEGGVITSTLSHSTLYTNLMVNSDNDVDTLFGCSRGEYTSKKANTFVNCIVDVKSIGGIICVTWNNPESVVSMSGIEGLSEPVVLSDTAEIVLGSGNAYTVNLGEYSDANVISAVTLGGETVTSYANNELTLTDAYKANTQKHGEQILKLKVEKAGKHYLIKKKVLVITKEIENLADLKAAVALDGNYTKFGYYRLKDDIVCDTNKVDEKKKPAEWIDYGSTSVNIDGKKFDFWKNDAGNYGFRGTFDGNNKTISSIFYSTGLFGTIGNGAVIKNITLTQKDYVATRMLLGYSMVGAKLENVTVNVNGKGTTTLPDVTKWQVGGLLTAIYAHSNEFKNVAINSKNTDVDTIFGSCSYYSYPAVGATNKFEGCVITAKSLIGLACTDNKNKTVTPYKKVEGLTVTVGE